MGLIGETFVKSVSKKHLDPHTSQPLSWNQNYCLFPTSPGNQRFVLQGNCAGKVQHLGASGRGEGGEKFHDENGKWMKLHIRKKIPPLSPRLKSWLAAKWTLPERRLNVFLRRNWVALEKRPRDTLIWRSLPTYTEWNSPGEKLIKQGLSLIFSA